VINDPVAPASLRIAQIGQELAHHRGGVVIQRPQEQVTLVIECRVQAAPTQPGHDGQVVK